jgi:hypothetical protein
MYANPVLHFTKPGIRIPGFELGQVDESKLLILA